MILAMVLHTIVSEYDVWGRGDKQRPICRKIEDAYVEGESFEGGIKIGRVISTNPKDYLDARYEIGKILR